MNQLFPRNLLPLLRCSYDAGELAVVQEVQANAEGLWDASLSCKQCAAEYRIEEGIARLLVANLSPEDQHEMAIRDTVDYDCTNPGPFVPPTDGWRSVLSDMLEVPGHLRQLELSTSCTVLELACGDGRFTSLMSQTGASVLAVDLSVNALRLMSHRLAPGVRVGRVHADINHLHVAPRGFDRALSTTPLDTRDQRMTMYRVIAEGLKDDGRYVGSVEYDDLNRRLLGLPLTRRYSREGILIEHLTFQALRRELAPFFLKLRIYPIRPRVPWVSKLPAKIAYPVLRLTEMLPVVRHFGELLVFRAEGAVRLPVEGQYREGSRLARNFFCSYLRRKNQEALWGEERVHNGNTPVQEIRAAEPHKGAPRSQFTDVA
jgi:SAM-dependent methyltransferase